MLVKDVMTPRVVSVSPENSVRQAASLMLDHNVSGLPVIDEEGRIVGVISEGDLIRRTELVSGAEAISDEMSSSADTRANAFVKRNSWRVGDAMTPDPVTVDEDASLMRVAKLMHERRIKRIPVTRSGALVGIVSRADLLHAILAARPDQTAGGDEAIQRSIIHRLRENTGLEDSHLSVTVIDGIVHLRGNIETKEGQRAARLVAEGVRGVRGVVEQFTAPDN